VTDDTSWLTRYEIVAEVTEAFHCANFITVGQTYVFDLRGVLDAARSTAPLCLGIIAKLHPALLLAADRAASGLHPISPRWHDFDCFDTGIDHGGTGKVFVRLALRDRATGAIVDDARAAAS
jgi:hypothetical protein